MAQLFIHEETDKNGMWLSEDTIAEPLTKTERMERGRYKSRTGSTRIDSDRIKK